MLADKLRIKDGTHIVVLNAPKGYKESLGELPADVKIKNKLAAKNAFVHLFIKNKAELENEMPAISKAIVPDGLIWISYPKGSSGMQTDLTRDKGWESLEKLNMQRLTLISFDDNWSAFLMKNTPPKEQTKASKDYHKVTAQLADPVSKTVIVPDDLAASLAKNKKACTFFDALSYSCRKEYIVWIVSAKQEQTRKDRIKKTIEKLAEGKKNPAMK